VNRSLLIRTGFIIGVWGFLNMPFLAEAQKLTGSHRMDSLQQAVKKVSGTQKADALNLLAFELFSFDTDQTFAFASEAFELSQRLGYDKGMAQASVYKGLYKRSSGDQAAATVLLRDGLKYARRAGEKEFEGYAALQLASYFTSQGQMDSALVMFQRSYAILKDSVHATYLSTLYKNWAKFYALQGDHSKKEDYLLRAMRIREAMDHPYLMCDIYMQVAFHYSNDGKYEMAKEYLEKAGALLPVIGDDPEPKYLLKYYKALYLIRLSDHREALYLLNEVKVYFRQHFSRQSYVNLLFEAGGVLADQGNYELSLSNSYEGLQIAEDNNLQYERTRLLWQIGWVYAMLKQPTLAEEFGKKSLVLAEQYNYPVELGTAYNLMGVVYDLKASYDTSLAYYDQALKIREKLSDPTWVASTLNNIGTVLEKLERYDEALQYQLKSLSIELEMNNLLGIAWSNFSIGQLYYNMKETGKAMIHLNQAESIAFNQNFKQVLYDVYRLKATLLEAQGKLPESIQYLKLYSQVKDSLHTTTLTNRIASLQNEYTILEKNKEIEILSMDKELKDAALEVQDARLRQQNIIILFGSSTFLLLVGGFYYIYRNYVREKRLNTTIQEKSAEIQLQAEALKESNETIARINHELEQMVDERTKELKQAYKELDTFFYRSSHDFRRPLTTFMGLAEVAKITLQDKTALELFEKVKETAASLDKMLIKLQSVSDVGSLNLIYKEVYFKELIDSVTDTFRDELRSQNIRVQADIHTTVPFYSYTALLKVIIENIVENAIMFSMPNQPILVKATTNDKGLTLVVEDSGIGIDPEYLNQVFEMYFRGSERSKGNGLGLYIVKKVVEKLGGNITLTSQAKKGTTVTVVLPHKVSPMEALAV
jgi:signal transduction histidine kinase